MKRSHLSISEKDELYYNKHVALVGSNLERADLRGMNLSGVNFTNANCRAADFSNANLDGAIFVKADLSRASLYRASCQEADFASADMTCCYARGTDFTNACFRGSIMRMMFAKFADFTGANLDIADILCAMLAWTNIEDQDLSDTFNVDRAIFKIYLRNDVRGKPRYDPGPDVFELEGELTRKTSYRTNAARERIEDYRIGLIPPYIGDITMAELEERDP